MFKNRFLKLVSYLAYQTLRVYKKSYRVTDKYTPTARYINSCKICSFFARVLCKFKKVHFLKRNIKFGRVLRLLQRSWQRFVALWSRTRGVEVAHYTKNMYKKLPCRAEVGINLALVLPLLHITFLSEKNLESTCFGAYFDTKFIHIQHNLASDSLMGLYLKHLRNSRSIL